jgi:deazaflavin-dependent oxidoreductase (nitroreductase family)
MPLEGEYAPSPWDLVADHVQLYEESGGEEGTEHEGAPCVILTTRGRTTGKLRKSALMRIEHNGTYAVIASMSGAPEHPRWYLNLVANPEVTLQDGGDVYDLRARTASQQEKAEWWPRAVEVWPPYDDYQQRTTRDIPLVLLEPI